MPIMTGAVSVLHPLCFDWKIILLMVAGYHCQRSITIRPMELSEEELHSAVTIETEKEGNES